MKALGIIIGIIYLPVGSYFLLEMIGYGLDILNISLVILLIIDCIHLIYRFIEVL